MNITTVIVIATLIISYRGFQNPGLIQNWKHWPYAEHRNKEWYRLLTSGFLHGGWFHLLINMFIFWQFGSIVESAYVSLFGATTGGFLFIALYLSSIAVADLPTYFKKKNQPQFSAIGASGAVSAILFVYILLMPWQTLYLWAIIPIPALLVGIGYLIYSHQASKNPNTRIDHDAHFYGAIYGLLFTVFLKPELFMRFIERLQDIPF